MIVKIHHAQLEQAASLLFNLPLVRTQSRHRTKLISLLEQRRLEVDHQRQELAKEHAEKDGNGEPIITEGVFEIKDKKSFQSDLKELYDEAFVLEGGDLQPMLESVKRSLLESDMVYRGKEALLYDYLCNQFEEEETE